MTTADDGGPARRSISTPEAPDAVAGLFGAVAVRRRTDGGVVIEAPPEAARSLLSLFEGMARLMATVAEPPRPTGSIPPFNGSKPRSRAQKKGGAP